MNGPLIAVLIVILINMFLNAGAIGTDRGIKSAREGIVDTIEWFAIAILVVWAVNS